ncbi:VTC domain-containing protein [Cokeromyces recurvatus]|uniref:VTC domain-containing protein n=1 Tax=Cokeromyces recurvatus TaxID=90255 RepID=UPI00221E57BF|nr:VTC domain-containing protein [Cokeromyces recurvatus]KAI7905332.1 VTC domain-containing protein [Cokeromyces recurvatus]
MKFGVEFNAKIFEPWRDSYVQYDKLKERLKETEESNDSFANQFEIELKKVYNFVQIRLQTMTSRIDYCNYLLRGYSKSKPAEDAYNSVADSLADILIDIDDLTKYHELNLIAFEKIANKHDNKVAGGILTPYFFDKLLYLYPLDKQRFDILVVRISEMYEVCRHYGNARLSCVDDNSSDIKQTAFERATYKYWVHPDNINQVKTIILLHLPIYVFNRKKQYESTDAAVSSVYFDNELFELYHERLDRSEGAEAIRIRWYGKSSELNDDVYVERKTHHAPWMYGKSIKDRFRIKGDQTNAYLSGTYTAKNYKEDLEKREKMDSKTIEDSYFIAEGIHDSIKRKELKPMCRVFYNRTAFQLPGDQRLRISLDSNLTFIREDHIDGRERRVTENRSSNWRRQDIGIEYPFRKVKESDILRFPYAVLEIKIQEHLGQEIPNWLNNLLKSHLVFQVPRFSKYIHGASCLFHDKVSNTPFWIEMLHEDIKKPVIQNIGLSRSQSFKALINGHHRKSLFAQNDIPLKVSTILEFKPKHESYTLMDTKKSNTKEINNQDIQHLSINFPENLVSPTLEHTEIDNLRFPHKFFKFWKKNNKAEEDIINTNKTSICKRRDSKVFFSNERTFMAWLHYCILLLTIAIRLVNGGDTVSKIIGSTFIALTVMVSIYSLARFHSRAYHLKNGYPTSTLEDIYGPITLCVLVAAAIIANFYLRLPLIMEKN